MGTRKIKSMTESIRDAIQAGGQSLLQLEKATGVKRASIMRFMRGDQSLRLDMADKLAAHFGLELRGK